MFFPENLKAFIEDCLRRRKKSSTNRMKTVTSERCNADTHNNRIPYDDATKEQHRTKVYITVVMLYIYIYIYIYLFILHYICYTYIIHIEICMYIYIYIYIYIYLFILHYVCYIYIIHIYMYVYIHIYIITF